MQRRRLAIVLGTAAGVLVLSVVLVPGLLARRLLASRLSQALGTSVRVGWASWNPFSGTWVIRSVRVDADRGTPALRARRIAARVYVSDVLRRRLRVRELTLDGARIRLRVSGTGWELPLPAHPAPPPDGAPSHRWPVDLETGQARKTTLRLEPRGGPVSLLRVRRLDAGGALSASGVVGASVRLGGRLDRAAVALGASLRQSDSRERMRVELSATDLDLGRSLRLVPGGTAPRQVSGVLDLHGDYRARRRGQHAERRLAGGLRADNLAVGGSPRPGLRVHSMELDRFDADLQSSAVSLGKLVLRQPEIWLIRDARGFALPGVFEPEAPATPAEGAPIWHVTGTGAEIDGGAVHYADARADERTLVLQIERGTLGALGEAGTPLPFSLTATLATGGRLEATGELERDPLRSRADVGMTDVELAALADLAGGPIRLASGRATAHLSLEAVAEGVSGSGMIEVVDVKTESPDAARPEDVIAWKTLRLDIRHFQSVPPGANLARVELDWPYVLIDRNVDRIFPLSLVAGPRATGDTATAASPIGTFNMRTDRLEVHGGRIDFRDETLTPAYWRSLAHLDVSAIPLALPPVRVPRLRADGLIDEISPLHAEGTIGSKTHLRADVSEVALTPFNVYLEPVSQYSVSSGTLSLHAEVTLERSQLDVDNRIVLSRFGLGGSVEEDFVKREVGIPLTLAVALMKDYRGDIELALPFAGNVSSPTFSFGQLVRQAVIRAIRGAVLSPLNALGRVFLRDGRIEQLALDPIPFAPGRRSLDQEGRERSVQVLRVLSLHAELALTLRGQVGEADVAWLKEDTVLAALPPSRRDPLRAYLEARRVGAPEPPLPRDQRERLQALIGVLPWPGEQLRQLADDRSAAVAAGFFLEGRLDPDRVHIEAAAVPTPEQLAPTPGVALQIPGG